MIWGINVEGSLLRHGPSVILSLSVEGSRLDTEPFAIWSISVEGSLLRYGPSVISSLSVEGSVLDNGTVREMGH